MPSHFRFPTLLLLGCFLSTLAAVPTAALAKIDPVVLVTQTQLPSAGSELQEEPAEKTSDEKVSVQGLADDRAIETRLQNAFESSGWFETIEVSAHNGIVTLEGTVDTEEHRQWAVDVVRRTEDVLAAIDKLDVAHQIDVTGNAAGVYESLSGLFHEFLERSPLLVLALIVLALTSLLSKFVAWLLHALLDSRSFRTSLKDLLSQLSSIAIWVLGFLTAAVVAFPGMTPSKAITVLGLGSIAIGFAFKDIFENFFAGVLILWQYPFDIGDYITCEGIEGRVEKITIRSTLIRQLDGELAVVPNALLFKNKVEVLTNHPQRRVRIICGVAYGEDVDRSRGVIREAVESCESVQGKRTIEVFAQEFADSSVNFEVAWWTGAKPVEIRRSRDEVIAAIKSALDREGIEIPFPYRTLTFKQPIAFHQSGDQQETLSGAASRG